MRCMTTIRMTINKHTRDKVKLPSQMTPIKNNSVPF